MDNNNNSNNSEMPDAISNLMNMLKNNNNNNSNGKDASGNPSISPENLANMVKMFQNSNNNSSDKKEESSNSNPSFDMDMLLKMKAIFEQMNKKDDPRSNLLMSLKPYLKESRKNKLDQYVQLFNMGKVLDIFNKASGGDSSK